MGYASASAIHPCGSSSAVRRWLRSLLRLPSYCPQVLGFGGGRSRAGHCDCQP
jgi:hypothetical protein